VFIVIRFAIYWQFRHNPGIFLATSYILQQSAILAAGYGYKTLVIVFSIVFFITYRWQEKPLFARWGLVPFVMMYFAYFLFGRPLEYRVFLDVLPLPALLITHTLIACTGLGGASWLLSSKGFIERKEPAMNDAHGPVRHP
jgi:hypothetical protein